MRIRKTATLVIAACTLVLAAAGCQRTVEVQTGVRVECPYGHVEEGGVTSVDVPASTAGSYRVRTERRVCDRHVRLEGLYAEAQSALGLGDVKTARARLELVTADDPSFRRAAEQLEAIAGGRTPNPDTEQDRPVSRPTTVAPKPGEDDTSGPVGSLVKYTPDSLDGFDAQGPATDPLSVSRQYTPSGPSDVFSLVIVAEQYRSAKEADAALDARMRSGFSQDASTARIGGHNVKLGTGGNGLASAGFSDGSILVVLEAAAKDGADPSELLGLLRKIVGQLP